MINSFRPVRSLSDRLLRLWNWVIDCADLKFVEKSYIKSVAPEKIPIFEQNLTICVPKITDAKKFVSTAIAHLSPLPVQQIMWQVGHVSTTGANIDDNSKGSYRLAIVRKSDLEALREGDDRHVETFEILAPSGLSYHFSDAHGRHRKLVRVFITLMFGLFFFFSLYWCLDMWTKRFSTQRDRISNEIMLAVNNADQLRAQLEIFEQDREILNKYGSKEDMRGLFAIVQNLPDILHNKDHIVRISFSSDETRLTLVATDPSQIIEKLSALIPDISVVKFSNEPGSTNQQAQFDIVVRAK